MKSKKLLDSFVCYCKAHPEERFWQALRNWCGWQFIYVSDVSPLDFLQHVGMYHDTYNWEDNKTEGQL